MSGEGAQGVVRFLAAFPWSVKNSTLYCGPVTVVGNTYAAMPGQGRGCRAADSTQPWCEKTPADFCGGKVPPPTNGDTCGGQTAPESLHVVTIGGQCNASEPSLPPRCTASDGLGEGFAACAQTPGVAGVCYNKTAAATTGVRCLRATELAELVAAAGRAATCKGFSSMCTLY